MGKRVPQGTQPAELPRGTANPQGVRRGTRRQEQGTGETPEETRKGARGREGDGRDPKKMALLGQSVRPTSASKLSRIRKPLPGCLFTA